jgi:hypothetical protein
MLHMKLEESPHMLIGRAQLKPTTNTIGTNIDEQQIKLKTKTI